MIEHILTLLATFVIQTIESMGYGGIMLLMALESANVPIPSEVIIPFSGYLVSTGVFNLYWAVFWGAVGNLAGSIIGYYIGYIGGRPFLEKYGKFFLITKHDLNLADKWFAKYGNAIAFVSRLLPIVRTFISVPAGIARMNIWKFSLYTFAGSLLWSFALAYIGVKMGENWDSLREYFHTFDWAIAGLIIAGGVWWVWRHIKLLRGENKR